MADIATVLDEAQAALTSLRDSAGAAVAGGAAQQQVIEAAWAAVAAVQAAKSKSEGLAARLKAQDQTLDAALAARKVALESATPAQTEGTPPPLADAAATALRGAVAAAAGVTDLQVDGELSGAVADLDAEIAAIADATDPLVIAQVVATEELKNRQSAFADKLALAEQALASAQGAPSALAAALTRALLRRAEASAALDQGEINAATVAYVDYQSARGLLTGEAGDSDGNALRAAWVAARDEALGALADRLQAELVLAEAERKLAVRRSAISVAQATRPADAEGAVAEAIAALLAPPPGP